MNGGSQDDLKTLSTLELFAPLSHLFASGTDLLHVTFDRWSFTLKKNLSRDDVYFLGWIFPSGSDTLGSHTQAHTLSAAGSDCERHLGFVSLRVLDKNADYAVRLPERGNNRGQMRLGRGERME